MCLSFRFGSTEPQHSREFLDADPIDGELCDLAEREAKILQHEDPVQCGELIGSIEPVSARRVDVRRFEQPDVGVVTKRAHRHLGELGELTDHEHGTSIDDTFPNGRVNTLSRASAHCPLTQHPGTFDQLARWRF